MLPRTVTDWLARSPKFSFPCGSWRAICWALLRPGSLSGCLCSAARVFKVHISGCVSAGKGSYLTIGASLHRYMSAGGAGKPPPPPPTRGFICGDMRTAYQGTAYSSVAFSTACQRFNPTGYDPADASMPAPASADCVPRSRWWFQNAERSACRGAW